MENYLILHGHFYQPPRESPWTGVIPYQESAEPFRDWNKRITKECYAANSASRILDPYGKIRKIVNNYEYLSFNFGPTLLSWLESRSPNVYRRILEADAKSVERLKGHGNAIAQVYNHMIMPLATRRQKEIQIDWGIRDFTRRFNRFPEGIWLAETAVNEDTIDLLIDRGIRYTILSPWQAEAFRLDGEKEWTELGSDPIPSHRAYRITRPGGTLSLFFYDQNLAQGISFGHYLRDADALHKTLSDLRTKKKGHLIHTATDGEIYGHHEPFGDMCLAALTEKILKEKDFHFINYGYYLDHHQPRAEVRLRPGDDGQGTSWSCHHGVLRWYKDCGCETGGKPGWNQKWRTPVREGFDNLYSRLEERFDEKLGAWGFDDPESLLRDYGDVIIGATKPRDFYQRLRGLSAGCPGQEEILSLFEAMKFGHFMFTSCGWFFADMGGIEPVQNMKYALRALELGGFDGHSREHKALISDLNRGSSNLREIGTGKEIFQNLVLSDRKRPAHAAAVFLFRRVLNDKAEETCYGDYVLDQINLKKRGGQSFMGTLSIRHTVLNKIDGFSVHLKEHPRKGLSVQLLNQLTKKKETVSLEQLPHRIRLRLADDLNRSVNRRFRKPSPGAFQEIQRAYLFTNGLGISAPRVIEATATLYIESRLKALLPYPRMKFTKQGRKEIQELLEFTGKNRVPLNTQLLNRQISRILGHQMDDLAERLDSQAAIIFFELLKASRSAGIEPDLTFSQNILYEMAEDRSQKTTEEKQLISDLCTHLGIAVTPSPLKRP